MPPLNNMQGYALHSRCQLIFSCDLKQSVCHLGSIDVAAHLAVMISAGQIRSHLVTTGQSLARSPGHRRTLVYATPLPSTVRRTGCVRHLWSLVRPQRALRKTAEPATLRLSLDLSRPITLIRCYVNFKNGTVFPP